MYSNFFIKFCRHSLLLLLFLEYSMKSFEVTSVLKLYLQKRNHFENEVTPTLFMEYSTKRRRSKEDGQNFIKKIEYTVELKYGDSQFFFASHIF